MNLLSAGQASPELIPHLCGASLLASKKKGGSHWPLRVVGEVLRYLVSKCLLRAVKSVANLNHRFTPMQVGVGSSLGVMLSFICSPTFGSPSDSHWVLCWIFLMHSTALIKIVCFRTHCQPGLRATMELHPVFFLVTMSSLAGVVSSKVTPCMGPLLFALTLVERIRHVVQDQLLEV